MELIASFYFITRFADVIYLIGILRVFFPLFFLVFFILRVYFPFFFLVFFLLLLVLEVRWVIFIDDSRVRRVHP